MSGIKNSFKLLLEEDEERFHQNVHLQSRIERSLHMLRYSGEVVETFLSTYFLGAMLFIDPEGANVDTYLGIDRGEKEYLRFSDLAPANREKIDHLVRKLRNLIYSNRLKEALQTFIAALKADNPLYVQLVSTDQDYQLLEQQLQQGELDQDEAKPGFEKIAEEIKMRLKRLRFEDLQ